MDPALITFGIQAIIRIGKAGMKAAEQYARDEGAVFPDLKDLEFDRKTYLATFFSEPDTKQYVIGENAPYAKYWITLNQPESADVLYVAAVRIESEKGKKLRKASEEIAGARLIKQWNPDKEPLSPFAGVILSAGDIILEYIGSDPSILGVGGNGEKLIGAFAKNLSTILPDDGKFGPKNRFGERLMGAFLRAGLETISRNPEWTVSEKHLEELIKASVSPLIDALPDDISEQVIFRDVADALMGPAANAAMQTMAKHPASFFGEDFSTQKAFGSLTQAFFAQAAETGLENLFTREGLIDLYGAALDVAAKKPELFLGETASAGDELSRDLLSRFASVLKDARPPFDGKVGVDLAVAAIDAVQENAHMFIDSADPWQKTAEEILQSVLNRLEEDLRHSGRIKMVLSKDQLTEIGRILLRHVAETPAMIVGARENLVQLTSVLAHAMAEDKNLLLGGNDWIEIFRTAAEEAAANPARIFMIDTNRPEKALAAQVLGLVFHAANETLQNGDLKSTTVLFGQTLRETIIILLRAASGNTKGTEENLQDVEVLVKTLGKFIAENSNSFGSKEFLRLFRLMLATVIDGESAPDLTIEIANSLLARR